MTSEFSRCNRTKRKHLVSKDVLSYTCDAGCVSVTASVPIFFVELKSFVIMLVVGSAVFDKYGRLYIYILLKYTFGLQNNYVLFVSVNVVRTMCQWRCRYSNRTQCSGDIAALPPLIRRPKPVPASTVDRSATTHLC